MSEHDDLWVFGYGSLMWRPGFDYVEQQTARLVGYRTQTKGRWQGLVLSIDDGGLWEVMSKTRGRLEEGETVTLQDRHGEDRWELAMLKRLDEGVWAARPLATEHGGRA